MGDAKKLRDRYTQLCAELGDIIIRRGRDERREAEIRAAVAGLETLMAQVAQTEREAMSGAPPETA